MNTKISIAALALAGFCSSAFAGKPTALPTCGASDLSGGTFLACTTYVSGNLISNNSSDLAATLSALVALGQKVGTDGVTHPFDGTSANWVEKLPSLSGNTIDFSMPLNGITFLGIHKGGGGQGGQGTAFYLIDAGSNLDKLTYNLSGLSNAALYQTVTTPVPEPETYALMLAGLAALGFLARRRASR